MKTTEENPEAEVLYWVDARRVTIRGQKTARALVQLLNYAGREFCSVGKKECCTGDSARRAGK